MSEVGASLMGDTAGIAICTPINKHRLNSFSSKTSHQNLNFNIYSETSKRQEGSVRANSYQKCFKMTNFDRFHREGVVTEAVSIMFWF